MKTVIEGKCKSTSAQVYLLFITVSSECSENQFYADFGKKVKGWPEFKKKKKRISLLIQ